MMTPHFLLNHYPSFMHLRVFIEQNDCELKMRYDDHVRNHNSKIFNDPTHIDAGFDLLVPHSLNFVRESSENENHVNKVNHRIKCSASIISDNRAPYNSGYYLHPRSSIIKTPLRLANSTGIVDSGYRGNIIGAFDCKKDHHFVNEFERLIQICAPSLMPIYVELVDNEYDLGEETARGGGGFGSSGR
jgi:dUTP pyrophosphatase